MSAYLSMLLLGLLGGGHCGAMCGGFAAALAGQPSTHTGRYAYPILYSVGRIGSYVIVGVALGALSGLGVRWFNLHAAQLVLYVASNVLLIAVGVSLSGLGTPAAWLERLGHRLWRKLQPLTRKVFPVNSVPRALGAGLLWGWMPCGLVYSALGVAMLSASAHEGAGLMLAFGIGTLPAILGASLVSVTVLRNHTWRVCAGLIITTFGVTGLVHASGLFGSNYSGIYCAF